jgi:formylmethanofuran dehydrogenase subunit E
MEGTGRSVRRHVGPVVACVRGPSRSGKTSLCERLIEGLQAAGKQVAYLKRTHHELDLPAKASGRIWARRPEAMVLHSVDRLQLTLPPPARGLADLLRFVPTDADVVLLETHSPEPVPTLLSRAFEPADEEDVVGRWSLETIDADAVAAREALLALVPADRTLDLALRAATRLHGGHTCAGLVLGTRLALHGAALLGLQVPDEQKRLIVTVETDRCAVDAIQAVTGCRPGRRTLRLLDHGKLAATFLDQWNGAAVRVAVRGDLRERASAGATSSDRHEVQRQAYLEMPAQELFEARPVTASVDQFDLPGPPRRRVLCIDCGEEVSDGREVATESGPRCRTCAAGGTPW